MTDAKPSIAADRLKSFLERGGYIHPKWKPSQIWAAVNWADPVYRQNRAASHAKAMARIIAGAGFLYTAEVIGTDEIKIGHALDPERRMADLMVDYSKDCRLLKTILGSLKEERRLHHKLRRFLGWPLQGLKLEFYPRSILSHEAIPEALRVMA